MISGAEKFVNEEMGDASRNVPYVGMKFEHPDEAYEFYRLYSRQLGFAITRRTSHNFYGIKYAVTFACTKNRKPIMECEEGFSRRTRGLVGTGCKARIVVKDRLLRGNWTVEEVELEHNHELSPDAVQLMRCHRQLPIFVKKQLEVNELAGLAQSKSIQAVFTQTGGLTQCHFTEKDMRNYVAEVRRLQLKKGDAQALMKYFRTQQSRCPNFFYEIDVDEEGRLRNVFWADARSRTSFKYFGDVITFDTTYLTNRYKMPFAVFVGVNHHGQSILLGCALLSNELKETFQWCFSTFVACMDGRAPEAIITDQCSSIGWAVREVFSNTRHRLCLWHIMKKPPEKTAGIIQKDELISKVSSAVYDSNMPEEFDEMWNNILELVKDGKDASWFHELYNLKKSWVPTFLRDKFWAGMSTTQRSEGMNAYFDSYINSKTTLRNFVEKYDVALHNKWEKELQEDFRCRELQPKLVTNCCFEKQFADVYTLRLFYLYQKEVKMLMTCYCEQVPSEWPDLRFIVREVSCSKPYRVQINAATCEYKCSCCYFEFRGIVCRHALCVYRQMGIQYFPDQYILPRWRKDFVRSHVSQMVPTLPVIRGIQSYGATYAAAHKILLDIVEIASTSRKLPEILILKLESLKNEIILSDDCDLQSTVRETTELDDSSAGETVIHDPLLVRSKGRPRSTRLKGGIEKSRKKRRTPQSAPNTQVNGTVFSPAGPEPSSVSTEDDEMVATPSAGVINMSLFDQSVDANTSATNLLLQFSNSV